MRSEDPGRYTVIHHIGPSGSGNGRPTGTYGLGLGGRPDHFVVAEPAAGDQEMDMD